MTPANPAILRAGTWNIRWFPRGCPSNQACPDLTTDIPWLACTIAWMNVDLLAIQEMLATPDAEFSLNSLRAELERLTGGSWQVDLHACGSPSTQHVGFLWKGARVALLQLTDVWELWHKKRNCLYHFPIFVTLLHDEVMDRLTSWHSL